MFRLLKRIAGHAASAPRVSKSALLISTAAEANGLHRHTFCFQAHLARLMQETDRSVS
jgi:hypothetical protein